MKEPQQFDSVILGAGLVGIVAALKAAHHGLAVALIEPRDFKKRANSPRDMRTTAVSYGATTVLGGIGVWEKLKECACPIEAIRTFEANSPASLNFMSESGTNTRFNHPLGYMVDNAVLRDVLEDTLLEAVQHNKITFFDGQTVEHFDIQDHGVILTLSSQQKIRTPLVVGAEGRHSPSRAAFGIRVESESYNQTALVATVLHEKPHHNTAFEVFHPTGPLAFLPFHDKDGAHRSAIVWSAVMDLKDAPVEELSQKIEALFPTLGTISIATTPAFYPLVKQTASALTASRYVLIGDAAHVMHPVAGQGVNLGWRDAAVLIDLVGTRHRLGLDIGSQTLLKKYEKARFLDQKSMMFMMDRLIWLFGQENESLKMIRTIGLSLVERLPPLKKFLMKKAMWG